MILATFLNKHPNIEKVFYPGLKSHPQHELAKIQLDGRYGGMLSFLVKKKSEKSDGITEAYEVLLFYYYYFYDYYNFYISNDSSNM